MSAAKLEQYRERQLSKHQQALNQYWSVRERYERALAQFDKRCAQQRDAIRAEEERKRRKQEERRRQLSYWRTLDGRQFEIESCTLLGRCFPDCKVRRTGKTGDGGVDILLERDGQTVVVQCKAHRQQIGPATVRELYGVMQDRGAVEGWVLTPQTFSREAQRFADGKPIRLLTIAELLEAADDGSLSW